MHALYNQLNCVGDNMQQVDCIISTTFILRLTWNYKAHDQLIFFLPQPVPTFVISRLMHTRVMMNAFSWQRAKVHTMMKMHNLSCFILFYLIIWVSGLRQGRRDLFIASLTDFQNCSPKAVANYKEECFVYVSWFPSTPQSNPKHRKGFKSGKKTQAKQISGSLHPLY